MEKEFYKLKGTDFIPLIGMINHLERCPQKEYNHKTSSRLTNAGLILYNFAIISGTIVASGLLESILNN